MDQSSMYWIMCVGGNQTAGNESKGVLRSLVERPLEENKLNNSQKSNE